MKIAILLNLILFCGWPAFSADIDAIKEKNKPISSKCFNLENQKVEQKSISSSFETSLRPYLKKHLNKTDKRKNITGALAATATEGTETVFIFYMAGPLESQSGWAFRSEHRMRLENLISKWRAGSSEGKSQQFFVRFTDECKIPAASWK